MNVNERGKILDRKIYPFYFIVMTTDSTKPTATAVIIFTECLPFQDIGLKGFILIVFLNLHTTYRCYYLYFPEKELRLRDMKGISHDHMDSIG